MPGHHVRFVDVLSTPSSTYSDVTLASSPGPCTPPAVIPSPLYAKGQLSPQHNYASSPLAGGHVQVHSVLAHSIGRGAPLYWDLSQPVSAAQVRTTSALSTLTEQLVMEPATSPKVASITIICERLPWAITVTPRQDASWAAPYVTIGDVLFTLYRTLRLPVTSAELNAHNDPAFHERIRDAYVTRYQRIAHPGERESEKAKGVKRVDFLFDARMFKGLSLVPEGMPGKGLAPGVVWRLHVARP
ncbi:hypothetical protein GY45DRAFT_1323283 [Cubamyces sp. BRFM 1775]|nr:hypothetical protein GY45DRAFT_1323283 [Cubamyces sp. BRFM 1775]